MSGIFPIDSTIKDYDEAMVAKFDCLLSQKGIRKPLRQLLPAVMVAGEEAGRLTPQGAALLGGLLPDGIPFAPSEGDAGTGMTATNAVAPGTGNVSAGTSIFSMVVLERPLQKVYEEIDLVTTPSGNMVAMVHCNNCTSDSNVWVGELKEAAELLGAEVSGGEIFTKLYLKSLEGDPDCGSVLVCNYLAGEGITHLNEGRPMVVRRTNSKFTLANFFRSTLYSTMASLKIGMDIIAKEKVVIKSLTGHGGLFKTPGVGQRYLAAACNAPVTCMESAGEGGPYGMALLVAYMVNKSAGESLDEYLSNRVFSDVKGITLFPEGEDGCGDPLASYWMHGKIADETDKYAIDGTLLRHNSRMYFVWSGREGDVSGLQDLYIAQMKDPYTLRSGRLMISTPEFEWEKLGGTGMPGKSFVNEGPFALKIKEDTYLLYSAAGSWCKDYCIAVMKLIDDDPLDPNAWLKYDKPIFSANDLVVGAGHCSVLKEGEKNLVFFHAWDKNEEHLSWNNVALWMGELVYTDGVFRIE